MWKICTSFSLIVLLIIGYSSSSDNEESSVVKNTERQVFKSAVIKKLDRLQYPIFDLVIDDDEVVGLSPDKKVCKNYVLKGDSKVCLLESQDEYALYADSDIEFMDDSFVEDDFEDEQILPPDIELLLGEVVTVTKDIEVFEYVFEE